MFKEKRVGYEASKENNGVGYEWMVEVCEGKCMGRNPGDEPLTLTRCHSCGVQQLHEALEGWKSVCGRGYNLKGIKVTICFSSLF